MILNVLLPLSLDLQCEDDNCFVLPKEIGELGYVENMTADLVLKFDVKGNCSIDYILEDDTLMSDFLDAEWHNADYDGVKMVSPFASLGHFDDLQEQVIQFMNNSIAFSFQIKEHHIIEEQD